MRYFNPIGAHSSGFIGEEPNGIPNNIFPLITQVAIKKIKEIKIFGNDWPTKDGTGVRDYIHVMDLADAHLKAFEYIMNNSDKNIQLNIGTGKGTSVMQLINTYEEVNKVNIPFVVVGRRNGDTPFSVADNKLAKKIIGWEPKRDLKLMCKDSWNWFIKNQKK